MVAERAIRDFAADGDSGKVRWCAWLSGLLGAPRADWPKGIFDLAEAVAGGVEGGGFGDLWQKAEGESALQFAREMASLPIDTKSLTKSDLRLIFLRQIMSSEVRNEDPVRSDVRILGTLEARGQTSDVVILGGLNEGVWPSSAKSDPWLNRAMRDDLGLLSSDRETGLAAHDFQHAACGRKVVFCRSIRDSQADTVPSRWISRLTMLLDGLPAQNGPDALRAMKRRGADLVAQAIALDRPAAAVERAPRPAPCPPVAARPRDLTVTEIETLIRDPYAIYAKHVLRLKRLDPLIARPDVRLRGIVLHAIVEAAVREGFDDDPGAIVERARSILAPLPFPTERAAWLARTEAFAADFAAMQVDRKPDVQRRWVEAKGRLDLPGEMSVRGKADRIDILRDGTAVIVDYKSGTPPAPKQILHFDRQLLIEAAMLEAGAFEGIPPTRVSEVMHIALRRAFEARPIDLRTDAEFDPTKSLEGLVRLMSAYLAPDQGYSSRRAMEKMSYSGDYDHLARFGEWDVGDPPVTLGVR